MLATCLWHGPSEVGCAFVVWLSCSSSEFSFVMD